MGRSRPIRAALALALFAPLFMFGERAFAIQQSEDRVWFGPVGITPGERAIVNIYAIGTADEVGEPNPAPWTFVVRAFDSRGTLVQQRRLQLARGVIGSVPLAIQNEADVAATPLRRRTFRAEIVAFNPQPDPPARWSATLEVIDRLTERTSILLGGPDTLPAPLGRSPGQ
jgi:hypothetical protein